MKKHIIAACCTILITVTAKIGVGHSAFFFNRQDGKLTTEFSASNVYINDGSSNHTIYILETAPEKGKIYTTESELTKDRKVLFSYTASKTTKVTAKGSTLKNVNAGNISAPNGQATLGWLLSSAEFGGKLMDSATDLEITADLLENGEFALNRDYILYLKH